MNVYDKIELMNQLKKEIEEELQSCFDEIEIVEEYTDDMKHDSVDGHYYYDTSKCEEHTPTVLCIKRNGEVVK